MSGHGRLFVPGELTTHTVPAELTRVTGALRGVGRQIVLIPTMGALHDGHRELIRRARRLGGDNVLVVSIFVNPLQFGEGEDLARYPRRLEEDLQVCREEAVELAFTPDVAAMYGDGSRIGVHPGPLGDELEGAVRPGHFAGVLTVVSKLFNIVRPHFAFFGEKDYQQLALIRRMVRELNFDLRVVGVPTIREADGLAMSSRNVYLSPEERITATALFAALSAGVAAGPWGAEAVLDAARAVLDSASEVDVDYLELRDRELRPNPVSGEARLLVAARLGRTRLIDNLAVRLGEPATGSMTESMTSVQEAGP